MSRNVIFSQPCYLFFSRYKKKSDLSEAGLCRSYTRKIYTRRNRLRMYIISMVILRSEPPYVSWYVVVAIIFCFRMFSCVQI